MEGTFKNPLPPARLPPLAALCSEAVLWGCSHSPHPWAPRSLGVLRAGSGNASISKQPFLPPKIDTEGGCLHPGLSPHPDSAHSHRTVALVQGAALAVTTALGMGGLLTNVFFFLYIYFECPPLQAEPGLILYVLFPNSWASPGFKCLGHRGHKGQLQAPKEKGMLCHRV